MFPSADHLIRAYYESLGKLASPAALTITGMPAHQSSHDHLHIRHADYVLAMRDLTTLELDVLGLRFAAASGTRTYTRHVSSHENIRAGESLTGRTHPDDPSLQEVMGIYALGHGNREIAARLSITESAVKRTLATARGKVLRHGVACGLIEPT